MKITIENCLAFQEKVEIELNKWNLFIGANNSGKSTLIKVLNFLKENRWHNPLFDVESGNLQWDIWRYSDFAYFEYFVNDQSDSNDIRISFEKELYGKSYLLSVVVKRSELGLADDGLDDENKAAEISSIEFKCNNQVLFLVNSDSLIIKQENIIHCLEKLEANAELEKITKDMLALESKEDMALNISTFRSYGHKSMVEVIQIIRVLINKPTLKFLNLIARRLTMELSSTTVIDDNTEPNLDFGSNLWARQMLNNHFNLDLVYRRFYYDDKNGIRNKVGFDWAIEQDGKTRSIHSFGKGTKCLVQLVNQLAGLKENRQEYYDSVKKEFSLAIVEPEKHMHPDWQVKLIHVLLNDMFKEGKHIIIETHSVHILKAIQVEVAKGNLDSREVTVHEFYRDKDIVRVNNVQFDQNGFLSNSGIWKGDFNVLLSNLELELWKIQQARIQPN
jgi:energy-coupling factor transporter ATP-binding protein EcfA2